MASNVPTSSYSETSDENPWAAKVLCRYYLHGMCREKENCRFSHNIKDKPSMICKFYNSGSCSFGDRCRYNHVKIGKTKSNEVTSLCRVAKKVGKDPTWVNASEFVPGQLWEMNKSDPISYANITEKTQGETEKECDAKTKLLSQELCPYAAKDVCMFIECPYLHGDICDLCEKQALHPHDPVASNKHTEECIREHERDMEESFAVQRSIDKSCGICMEVVIDKTPYSEARFGVLSHCNHVYCVACIRKWRAEKQFESQIIRACPECRVKSDFVIPSKYWIEDQSDKDKLIETYKKALSNKPCKHFDQGKGECPFGSHCFYKHAYPDGRIASPKPPRRRRQNADGELDDIAHFAIWDYLEERFLSTLELDFLIETLHSEFLDSSSDESDIF